MAEAPVYPANKIPLPQRRNYSYTDRSRHSTTTMESGPPRKRLRSRVAPRDYAMDLLFTDGQLAYFEWWTETVLDAEQSWFWMPLRSGNGVNLTLIQLTKIGRKQLEGRFWRVAIQAISYQRDALTLTEEQLNVVVETGTFELQQAVHRLDLLVKEGW